MAALALTKDALGSKHLSTIDEFRTFRAGRFSGCIWVEGPEHVFKSSSPVYHSHFMRVM